MNFNGSEKKRAAQQNACGEIEDHREDFF